MSVMGVGRILSFFAVFFLFSACKTQPYKSPDRIISSGIDVTKLTGNHVEKSAELATQISNLSSNILYSEALSLSNSAIIKAEELRHEYDIFGPPLFHNLLVNTGLKERGLCYQWAEDIYPELVKLDLKSIDVHRAIALRGHLREHSALVVTPEGGSFYQGLVLDPWKHSGYLAWVLVEESKYPWRPSDKVTQEMIDAWNRHEEMENDRSNSPDDKFLSRDNFRFHR